jgi:hypothetical protein
VGFGTALHDESAHALAATVIGGALNLDPPTGSLLQI